ncbi:MAG TPA: hypothetical protein VGP88_06155 [Thermoplasmata archaeon]|jgi:hypothetical protein|nr:hypothetical protein [Thermoplasmata archaeon]
MPRKPAPELAPPTASFVERNEVEVFRFPADMTGAGPKPAFDVLLSTLPRVMERDIYGTFQARDGPAEYFACATRLPSDLPHYPDLATGTVPGGLYVRRIYLTDWRRMIPDIPGIFHRLVDEFHHDAKRPSIEFYRGDNELQLLLPVLDRKERSPRD